MIQVPPEMAYEFDSVVCRRCVFVGIVIGMIIGYGLSMAVLTW